MLFPPGGLTRTVAQRPAGDRDDENRHRGHHHSGTPDPRTEGVRTPEVRGEQHRSDAARDNVSDEYRAIRPGCPEHDHENAGDESGHQRQHRGGQERLTADRTTSQADRLRTRASKRAVSKKRDCQGEAQDRVQRDVREVPERGRCGDRQIGGVRQQPNEGGEHQAEEHVRRSIGDRRNRKV